MAYTRKHVKERFRPKPGRLLDQVREVMRYHHYAIRTEQTYVKWILDYIRFNGTWDLREMGKPEIERFLSHLAVNRNLASSTQNQALNAILFPYREILKNDMSFCGLNGPFGHLNGRFAALSVIWRQFRGAPIFLNLPLHCF